jgi:thioredoxin reductase
MGFMVNGSVFCRAVVGAGAAGLAAATE